MKTSFEITGVAPYLAKLHSLSDIKAIEKTTRATYGKFATRVIAPKLAADPGWKYGGHGGKYPTKGILGNKRSITARKVRTRQGEFIAISVKHRKWAGTVEAWVVKGTKPHTIKAAEGSALVVDGRPVREVHHPGAKGRDFVRDAVQGIESQLMTELSRELFKQADRAAAGKK